MDLLMDAALVQVRSAVSSQITVFGVNLSIGWKSTKSLPRRCTCISVDKDPLLYSLFQGLTGLPTELV